MNLTEDTVQKMIERLARSFAEWLRGRTVEQLYSAESAAKLLEVTERTFHSYADLYERTGGKDGIGPKITLSFKTVRYRASSINRFLQARTMTAGKRLEEQREAAAIREVEQTDPQRLEAVV
jgi:hypothetical protein